MILDYEFAPGDFAEFISINKDDEDIRTKVKIVSRIPEGNDVWYVVAGPESFFDDVECEIMHTDQQIPIGWVAAFVHADELEPSETDNFIKIIV